MSLTSAVRLRGIPTNRHPRELTLTSSPRRRGSSFTRTARRYFTLPFRPDGESLFFAWPKKSNQKKGRGQLGPRLRGPSGSLRCSIYRGVVKLVAALLRHPTTLFPDNSALLAHVNGEPGSVQPIRLAPQEKNQLAVCSPFAKVGSNSQILLQREYAESAKEGGNCMIPLKNVRM